MRVQRRHLPPAGPGAASAVLAALFLALWPFTVSSAQVHADPLFESDTLLSLRLSAPLRSIARDRSSEPEYLGGVLTLLTAGGKEETFEVKVRPRGNSRRDREVCRFPPLRVNFRKSEVEGTVFAGQDKLKMVTHCRPGERHRKFVYKEYLAYRMLNQVTPTAFRVRPLQVEYVDTDRDDRRETHFGFFIEHDQRLARRLETTVVEPDTGVDYRLLEPEQASLMELFQFMIGNTDFSFLRAEEGGCCHNAVLLSAGEDRYAPVPYDFDISGFVDPPYAVVDHQLPIRTVRQRFYRGICREGGVHELAVRRFQESREAIFATLQNETGLEADERREAVAYIESFYDVLDDPERLTDDVLNACRG